MASRETLDFQSSGFYILVLLLDLPIEMLTSVREMGKSTEVKEKTKGKRAGLFSVLGPYKGIVFILIVMALAGSAVNLLIPKIIARGIDAYSANKLDLRVVITEFLLAAAGIFLFTLVQGVIQTFTSERVAKDLRTKVSDKISRQTYSYILKSDPSKFLTNLTSDMDSVKMFVSQAFVNIISSVFVIIGAAVLLITINWKLALAVLVIVPIIAGRLFYGFPESEGHFQKEQGGHRCPEQDHQ